MSRTGLPVNYAFQAANTADSEGMHMYMSVWRLLEDPLT